MPRAIIDATAGSEVGIVSLGSCDGAIHEAIDMLKAQGVGVDYMRVRAFPFSEDVEQFLAAHELLFVVEQNRDAQLRALLTLETAVEKSKLRSLLHYSGLPISSRVHRRGSAGRAQRRAAQARQRRRRAPWLSAAGDRHDFHRQAQSRPSVAADERARLHAPRLRGGAVDAVRRLRPRLDHRRDRGGQLGAVASSRRTW